MEQTNQTFKAGDKVYYPQASTKVYTLSKNTTGVSGNYPLALPSVTSKGEHRSFMLDGRFWESDTNSVLFLATKENCKKLSELYGVQFEEPKSFLDIHLEQGSKVLCLIVNENFKGALPKFIWETDPTVHRIDIIIRKENSIYYTEQHKIVYYRNTYPIAIDDKGKITYLD